MDRNPERVKLQIEFIMDFDLKHYTKLPLRWIYNESAFITRAGKDAFSENGRQKNSNELTLFACTGSCIESINIIKLFEN